MDLLTSFRILFIFVLFQGLVLAQIPPDPFELAKDAGEDMEGVNQQFIDPERIEKLTAKVKPAVVTVRQIGRDGDQRGVGTGFVIDKSGLIATNFHVIGESRPIEVEFNDGAVFPVIEIHSSDRNFDLAVLRIDPKGKELRSLALGESDSLKQGQFIVGFGTPLGLKFSVVSGVISAIRKLEKDFLGEETPDYPMIQIAMPIEQGNSGGPIVNLEGEVMGVVTLRHRVKENLGFAVRSSDLKIILEKPNPVPMERWKTIGTLDPRQWTVIMKGDWQQRAGVIISKNPGAGFGGRTLCLSESPVPDGVLEVSVKVKLDDESGAAGLAFASDGGDIHYGFYPSNGKLRLTRFNGPDVYSWQILADQKVEYYRPGEWNHIKVRVDGDTITGFVNGKEAIVVRDSGLEGRRVGLCKFRKTAAQFRSFQVGTKLDFETLSEVQLKNYQSEITAFMESRDKEAVLGKFAVNHEASQKFLEEKAGQFELLAKEMRDLKTGLHFKGVAKDLKSALNGEKNGAADLFEIALQLARIDDPELDQEHYRSVFTQMVSDARTYLGNAKDKDAALKLRDFLFKESGFHGSRNEYYHNANSYINHVIDDREGLPITLSVVFIEMARRLEIKGVFGVPFPGQFLVGYRKADSDEILMINVFENGREMTRRDAEDQAVEYGVQVNDSTFQPANPGEIAIRMLRNLIGLEIDQKRNPLGALSYLNLLLEIDPNETEARFQRALVQAQAEDFKGARKDLDWLIEKRPPGLDYSRLLQFREALP